MRRWREGLSGLADGWALGVLVAWVAGRPAPVEVALVMGLSAAAARLVSPVAAGRSAPVGMAALVLGGLVALGEPPLLAALAAAALVVWWAVASSEQEALALVGTLAVLVVAPAQGVALVAVAAKVAAISRPVADGVLGTGRQARAFASLPAVLGGLWLALFGAWPGAGRLAGILWRELGRFVGDLLAPLLGAFAVLLTPVFWLVEALVRHVHPHARTPPAGPVHPGRRPWATATAHPLHLPLTALALVALLIALAFVLRRRRAAPAEAGRPTLFAASDPAPMRGRPGRSGHRGSGERLHGVRAAYAKVWRRLDAAGLVGNGDTARRLERVVSSWHPDAQGLYAELLALYERARYAGRESAAEARRADELAMRLVGHLRKGRR
jgi:hypothetical protein